MSKGAGNLPDNESRIPLAYDAMSHDSCLFTEDVRYSNQISQTEHKFWRYRRWVFSYFILVHIAFALTYSAIVRSRVPYPLDALSKGSYSPAMEVIHYEMHDQHPTSHGNYTQFSGPPSPENNLAWDALVRPLFFSASKEDMISAGESVEDSAELVEGGYLAALGVYHNLHCLRQLRLFLYKEVYYPNLTHPQLKYLHGHLGNAFSPWKLLDYLIGLNLDILYVLDHCIESLRVSLMCTADTSVYTFRWQDPPQDKPATKSNARRSCVDWAAFEDWSRKRMVPLAPRMKMPMVPSVIHA